jgi:hypothetical protein
MVRHGTAARELGMGKKPPPPPPAEPAWTDRDGALWHTCEIAADLAQGRTPPNRLEVATPFPPQLAADEVTWASGRFQLLEHRALGDGSYAHSSDFLLATGPGGMTLMTAMAVGTAVGNNARRRAAQAAAAPRWTLIDAGVLYVSGYGFYLHVTNGLLPWRWSDITMASMVGPAAVQLAGNSQRGTISWILRSDWAELVFVTWAFDRHPRHPQLVTGEWLPPGWLQRAAARYPTRLATPAMGSGD